MAGLLSMTGHGRALQSSEGLSIEVEVRSVNNRFLKVTYKLHESLGYLENQIESLIRKKLRRGSVHVLIRASGTANLSANKVSVATLMSYIDQARKAMEFPDLMKVELGTALQLPGVLIPNEGPDPEKVTNLTLSTVSQALDHLNRMRKVEGDQMAKEFIDVIGKVQCLSGEIETRAPLVLSDYRKRLESRVKSALEELVPSIGEIDVLREVVQFSDRSDIREEIVRLNSHLQQFLTTIDQQDSQGRRLDFLTQEIARETNTIGAKANDATIAHHVVAIKTAIETVRELVQNVE